MTFDSGTYQTLDKAVISIPKWRLTKCPIAAFDVHYYEDTKMEELTSSRCSRCHYPKSVNLITLSKFSYNTTKIT